MFGENKKEIIKNILGTILVVSGIYLIMLFGSAYEDHMKCLNGYTEVCIPEDFNK